MLDPHPVLADDLFTDAIRSTEQVLGIKITDLRVRARHAGARLAGWRSRGAPADDLVATGGAGYWLPTWYALTSDGIPAGDR